MYTKYNLYIYKSQIKKMKKITKKVFTCTLFKKALDNFMLQ
jgi:hypothetical protein